MDDRRLEFGVGVLVLAAIGVGIILMFIFGAYPVLLKNEYAITANFPSIVGIEENTPVVKFGYKIGRVTEIQLVNEGVDVRMMIDAKYPIRKYEVPRIGTQRLITGSSQIEFVRASESQMLSLFDGIAGKQPDKQLQPEEMAISQEFVPSGGYYVKVDNSAATDPFGMLMTFQDDVKATLHSIDQAGHSVTELADNMNSTVGVLFESDDSSIKNIASQTTQTLNQFRSTMSEVQAILQETEMKTHLREALKRMPNLIDEAEETLEISQKTIESFEAVGNSINDTVRTVDRTVRNVERFTEPMADSGDQLFDSVLESLTSLDQALAQLAVFGEQLNKGDGTVRRLIEDDELYWQVRRIAGNIENITSRVRPIIDDARVFADKIARDPGTLGVRGALNRRPQGTGLK